MTRVFGMVLTALMLLTACSSSDPAAGASAPSSEAGTEAATGLLAGAEASALLAPEQNPSCRVGGTDICDADEPELPSAQEVNDTLDALPVLGYEGATYAFRELEKLLQQGALQVPSQVIDAYIADTETALLDETTLDVFESVYRRRLDELRAISTSGCEP